MTVTGIVATVKAPLECLQAWRRHHERIGIRRFILFFDDPNDPSFDALKDEKGVTAVRCDDRYWRDNGEKPNQVPPRQIVNLHRGMFMARELGVDWIAHIDSDELIRPLCPMDEVLSRAGVNALLLDLREAVSERMDYKSIFEPTLFKKPPSQGQMRTARRLGCKNAFGYGSFFHGHTQSKTLFRLDGNVRRMGIHRPLEWHGEPSMGMTRDIQLLHFDGVGFADWDAKWAARSVNHFGMRPARRRQLEAYRDAAARGESSRLRLFRESQLMTPWTRFVLRRLKLVERIVLDQSMHRPPGTL